METIPLPHSFNEEKLDKNKSVFTIEPLFPGFGRTVGNALRRVLFSSLPGVAITSAKIEGVQHEFSTMPHIKEDVLDIFLNLKQVKVHAASEVFESGDKVKLTMKVEGAKTVTAGDFEKLAGVQILNPKHVLATITDDAGIFEMSATIGKGRGYSPIEARKKEKDKEIGVVGVDALYTPVIHVGYDLENVRVGQMTNWDSLKMTVETNGAISPKEALKESAQILLDHFKAVNTFETVGEESVEEPAEEIDEAPEESNEENDSEDNSTKEDENPEDENEIQEEKT